VVALSQWRKGAYQLPDSISFLAPLESPGLKVTRIAAPTLIIDGWLSLPDGIDNTD
jgi:hypothetical protein